VAVIAALMERGDHGIPKVLLVVVVNGFVIVMRSSDPNTGSKKESITWALERIPVSKLMVCCLGTDDVRST
jgi:hypothetical protein